MIILKKEKIVEEKTKIYCSSTLSLWQEGQITFLPIPLNLFPQSLHLYFLDFNFPKSTSAIGPPELHMFSPQKYAQYLNKII